MPQTKSSRASQDTPRHQDAESEHPRGIAEDVHLQCDAIEKMRVEQTDKMRQLLLKLGKLHKPKTAALRES